MTDPGASPLRRLFRWKGLLSLEIVAVQGGKGPLIVTRLSGYDIKTCYTLIP